MYPITPLIKGEVSFWKRYVLRNNPFIPAAFRITLKPYPDQCPAGDPVYSMVERGKPGDH